MPLKPLIIEMIEARREASHIFHIFDEMYSKSNRDNRRGYFHLFMCLAIQYNHIDLIKDVFEDKRSDVLTSPECILTSLLAAISGGNVAIVEQILQTSTSFKLHGEEDLCSRRLVMDPNNLHFRSILCLSGRSRPNRHKMDAIALKDFISTQLSPIEFACIYDQREVLSILVRYDLDQQCSTAKPIVYDTREEIKLNSALQAAVQLLHSAEFRKMLTLPSIIQIILDMKSADNAVYFNTFAALEFLINMIKSQASRHIDLAPEEYRAIVDTARILLDAGAITTGREKCALLSKLLESISYLSSYISSTENNHPENYFKVIPELIEQILKHDEVQIEAVERMNMIDSVLQEIAELGLVHGEVSDAANKRMCRDGLNNMTDIFHYYTSAYPDVVDGCFSVNDRVFGSDLETGYQRNLFGQAFVYVVALYSSDSGRSDNNVRRMLNCLNKQQTDRLFAKLICMFLLKEHPPFFTARYYKPGFPEHILTALRLVERLQDVKRPFSLLEDKGPFSLHHLSRCTITRAMSDRCLDEQKMSTLGVPKSIQQYILQECIIRLNWQQFI